LFKNHASEEKYEIIQTYLNKAAILSEMGRHEKAIEEIQKGKKFIDLIEK
jgi:tetratricopeptide (TPR) repeat protein